MCKSSDFFHFFQFQALLHYLPPPVNLDFSVRSFYFVSLVAPGHTVQLGDFKFWHFTPHNITRIESVIKPN